MKRIFTLLFLTTICFASNAQRLVLIEEFTQASCPPCETSTPQLDATLHSNADKVVQIRYQTSWPGVDPMNADNPEEVQARVDFYGVTGVPALKINGNDAVGATFPVLVTDGNIESEAALETPISMTLTHTLSTDLTTISVTAEITNNSSEAYAGNMLRIAMVEEAINWPTPPGSTSIQDFEYVMKKFVTNVSGMALPEIAAGETWSQSWTDVSVPGVVYNYNKLAVVAWVQNTTSKAVDNAAVSNAMELSGYPDLGISSMVTEQGGLCDLAFVGSATVANASDQTVSEYNVNMVINGVNQGTVTGTQEIAAGESINIDFEEINLPPGTSAISFNVETDLDIASLNNSTAPIVVGKADVAMAAVEKGFESDALGALPGGAIIDRPFASLNFIVVNQAGLNANNALGGFGMSENTVMINFWNWNPANISANGSMIIGEQFSVPEEGANLTFDHAYTSWGASNDRLAIEISTDCGDTYTEVWNQAGANLRTAPELNADNQYFLPTVEQWTANSIDLTDFAGQDILVKFNVTSAWGDMLYIDNVIMQMTTGLTEIENVDVFELSPNPASELLNIDFKLDNKEEYSLTLLDFSGKMVSTIVRNSQSQTTTSVDISNLASGLYFVQATTAEGVKVKKFVKQ